MAMDPTAEPGTPGPAASGPAPGAAIPAPAPGAAIPAPAPGVVAPAVEKLNVTYHAIIGVAIGLVALITGLAWPFAILTGMVIGKANSDRRLGRAERSSVVQLLAVTGGVLAMLLFGALIGGLFAFMIVALAAYSERVAENTKPVDQTMARILIAMIGAVVWFVVWAVLGLKINLSFG